MGLCFSSPKKKDILADSREIIEANARILSVCTELAPDTMRASVDKVYDEVRYMLPTTSAGAMQADKKIGAYAGDLKIALSKGNGRGEAQADEILKDLSSMIAERNSYTK